MSCNKKLESNQAPTPPVAFVEKQPTLQESLQIEPQSPAPEISPEVKPEPPPKPTPEPTPKPSVASQPEKKKTPPAPEVKKPATPKPTAPKPADQPKPATPPKKTPAPKPAPIVPPQQEQKKTEAVTASNMIIAAYNTATKEGKKIGAACNLYILRVLQVLGYKTVHFLANDFDVAAPKIFKSYKVFKFTNTTELKRHLWSYRERTGFILQWERSGGSAGHVAIVERVGETLYIYQASLNKYTARVEKTTLERLLSVNSNKGVRVYSDFQK